MVIGLALVVAGLLAVVVLGPLFFFSGHLLAAKRRALFDYGILTSGFVREFDQARQRHAAAADQTETINANVQSLADMLEVVRGIETMRAVPFGKETVIQLVAAALLPVALLVLTMMPLADLFKHLVKVVF